MNTLHKSPLGKHSAYSDQYDPGLLFAVPRTRQRTGIGIGHETALPFHGYDIWHAYELSWLNLNGLPQIAIGRLGFPASSPNIVESKSLKLYLNSFNQTRLESAAILKLALEQDLHAASGTEIIVEIVLPEHFSELRLSEPPGLLLDTLTPSISHYQPHPELLTHTDTPAREALVSHLLKSNCPITGQPDWASLLIDYGGPRIDHEGLLAYIVSYRQHAGFHEHCVERIFMDLMRRCRPEYLTVEARYTRRGGLDINPVRSTEPFPYARASGRLARQ
ncbi:NADPH-dependent 7-cyano-7-deazaguanine reductase QueF [Candidatus Methylospira mobilis]|uniref:NADPH-dependent 7-cyano-7-deazaguanine reductase n=1 Tax=Candidatus Methylospira mobilis TaxID=1808979 RepID=A0A5Q0BH63_9GAMM|nr:NADPH-dependent 7-cyano-7-deazaguanine reductase QueF [Candidatus Methylospira mobilis]QFY43160.1 NADPH-dependent 7-cyano-7-deazaguanine reductase QueF [Candidatus Methylospira mobilis]